MGTSVVLELMEFLEGTDPDFCEVLPNPVRHAHSYVSRTRRLVLVSVTLCKERAEYDKRY